MSTERIDLRRFQNQPELIAAETARRREHLISLGFSERWIASASKFRRSLWAPEVVDEHLQGLTDRCFTNPKRMIESQRALLEYSFEDIDDTIKGLEERGFANPKKMLESFTSLFTYSFENIDAKREGLRQRGFINPDKIFESSPSLFGLSFENIDAKINGLTERGFQNPKNLLETSPAIFGYSFQNIDRRLKLYRRLINLYDLPFEATQLIEEAPSLFAAKLDKIIVLVRVLREYGVAPETLNENIIQRLVRFNLENILVAFSNAEPDEGIVTLLRRADRVRRERLSRDEKRNIIEESLPDSKLKRRYFKAYPQQQPPEPQSQEE